MKKGKSLPNLKIISLIGGTIFLILIGYPTFNNIFNGVADNTKSGGVRNGLVNGIKECIIRDSDGLSTNFYDVNSYKIEYKFFNISPVNGSCYSAKATPKKNYDTWYKIDFDKETGFSSKTCGDGFDKKYGCKNNEW